MSRRCTHADQRFTYGEILMRDWDGDAELTPETVRRMGQSVATVPVTGVEQRRTHRYCRLKPIPCQAEGQIVPDPEY